MRIVLSIGGSILVPELDQEKFREYAAVITTLTQEHDIYVVTGGGVMAREHIDVARAVGANEVELDQIGIDVTQLNARVLIAALSEDAVLTPPQSYESARRALRRGEIVVMGGTTPAQTTDAVSAVLAEYVNAERLVYATSVPGVYDSDPSTHPDAEPFDELTPSQLISLIIDLDMTAGSSVPIDLLAAKVIQRAKIETIVLDGTDPHHYCYPRRRIRGNYDCSGRWRRFLLLIYIPLPVVPVETGERHLNSGRLTGVGSLKGRTKSFGALSRTKAG